MSPQINNHLAQTVKALHKSDTPLILTNIWDAITATTITSLPETTAIAAASYAIAAAAGLPGSSLTLEVNLAAVKAIARLAYTANKSLTVNWQDEYGDILEEGVREVIRAGAVGINLGDYGREVGEGGGLYTLPEAQDRIRRVLHVASLEGVPDFVINARTDALVVGLSIDEAITRAQAYLEAGVHNTFIWGGRERGGMTRGEVEKASRALRGRLNVSLVRDKTGGLSVDALRRIGVARISVGPQLMQRTSGAVAEEAKRILAGESV
jgi:2-methylisocitrate lyase-like PEP mutase family enzyme